VSAAGGKSRMPLVSSSSSSLAGGNNIRRDEGKLLCCAVGDVEDLISWAEVRREGREGGREGWGWSYSLPDLLFFSSSVYRFLMLLSATFSLPPSLPPSKNTGFRRPRVHLFRATACCYARARTERSAFYYRPVAFDSVKRGVAPSCCADTGGTVFVFPCRACVEDAVGEQQQLQ